jgi:Zn-finger nucleic acid-binding protein
VICWQLVEVPGQSAASTHSVPLDELDAALELDAAVDVVDAADVTLETVETPPVPPPEEEDTALTAPPFAEPELLDVLEVLEPLGAPPMPPPLEDGDPLGCPPLGEPPRGDPLLDELLAPPLATRSGPYTEHDVTEPARSPDARAHVAAFDVMGQAKRIEATIAERSRAVDRPPAPSLGAESPDQALQRRAETAPRTSLSGARPCNGDRVSSGYREAFLTCPVCGETLAPANVRDAIVDVCGSCGGVWVDWFDGDLVQMVRGTPAVPTARLPERPGSFSCPRCQLLLEDERYQDSRAEVLRCGECAGVFVPHGSITAVAALVEQRQPEKPLDAFSKLSLTLRRWLGWREE